MQNFQLKKSELINREALKKIVGGGSACEGDKPAVIYSWECSDGTSGTNNVCQEHLSAMDDMISEFCSYPV